MINYFEIIHKYIQPETLAYQIYVPHVILVTAKALATAQRLNLSPEEQQFIEEAAMLHDIGIVTTDEPGLGCYGDLSYICHGVEGRKMLEAEGLPQHALVAERHTGVGISLAEIITHNYPLPQRNMLAESLAEEVISWADLFYGKNQMWVERAPTEVEARLLRFGAEKLLVFKDWQARFGGS